MYTHSHQYSGFSLVELMIVIAIIGILSSVAIPAYNGYVVRTKIADLMLQARPFKLGMEQSYQINGTMPKTASEIGLSNVSGDRYQIIMRADPYNPTTNGEIIIEVWTGGYTGSDVNFHFSLTPTVTNGVIDWNCGPRGGTSNKYLPASCQ